MSDPLFKKKFGNTKTLYFTYCHTKYKIVLEIKLIRDCFLSLTSWGICQVFTPSEAEQNIEAKKRTILDWAGAGLGLFLTEMER